ncbi:MAG: hypothetical protein OXI15_10610 [Chromatiales bacterium]|nr:hypothetical protein [Chromatiales bacterium]
MDIEIFDPQKAVRVAQAMSLTAMGTAHQSSVDSRDGAHRQCR